jgi:HAD superfamily hydrolase (TIGR01509 family)
MQGTLMPDKAIDSILFDMDGTLFGTEEIWYQSELKIMARFGVEWNRADHAYCVGGPMSKVTKYMLEKMNNQISAHELFDLEMEYIEREFALSPIPWQPGANELVHEALDAGISIALVTASSRHLVNLVNAQIDLSIFHAIVCGDDVLEPKPNPEAYLQGLSKLNANPNTSIAIEDSNSGVKSALGADLHVLCPPSHQIIVDDPRIRFVKSLEGIKLADLEYWNWNF